MTQRTRTIILSSGGILLFGLIAAWWYSGFSLDFMKFFAAEPQAAATPTPTSTPATGGLVRCSPSTQATVVGQAVTLTASGGNGTYTWFAPRATNASGNAIDGTTGASVTLSYGGGGTKKVTIQSPRGDGSGNIDTVVCTVEVK